MSVFNEILTPYEAEEYLGIGKNTMYKLLNEGEINGFRIGRTWKVPTQALDEYVERRMHSPKRKAGQC